MLKAKFPKNKSAIVLVQLDIWHRRYINKNLNIMQVYLKLMYVLYYDMFKDFVTKYSICANQRHFEDNKRIREAIIANEL